MCYCISSAVCIMTISFCSDGKKRYACSCDDCRLNLVVCCVGGCMVAIEKKLSVTKVVSRMCLYVWITSTCFGYLSCIEQQMICNSDAQIGSK